MGRPGDQALPPLVGNLWVPVWAVRPGSYGVLAPLAAAMPLWLLLHSRNGDYWKPCYATREQLGSTLGIGRAAVSRRLGKLRRASLLLEVDRGVEPRTQRRRATARWALDPFAADLWREKVEQALAQVAETDGQDGRWYGNAIRALDAFERKCRVMGARIGEDMPFLPKPRRRKRRKSEPGSKMDPGAQNGPGGEVFTRVGGSGGESSVGGASKTHTRKRT